MAIEVVPERPQEGFPAMFWLKSQWEEAIKKGGEAGSINQTRAPLFQLEMGPLAQQEDKTGQAGNAAFPTAECWKALSGTKFLCYSLESNA